MGKICKGCGNFCKEENEKCVHCGETFKDRSKEVKVVKKQLQTNFTPRPSITETSLVKLPLESDKEFTAPDYKSIRIVLLGKTGAGKSATANSLLRKEAFKTELSPKSITTHCKKDEAVVDGKHVVVVDTPGLFDTKYSNEEIREEILKGIGLILPGPNLFLIVLPFSRITQEELVTLSKIFEIFEGEIGKYSMIVFTRLDELQREKKGVEQFIQESDERLKSFIHKCEGRYVAVNNAIENPINKAVSEKKLAQKVFKIAEELGYDYFENKIIETTNTAVKEISAQYEEICQESDFEEPIIDSSTVAEIINPEDATDIPAPAKNIEIPNSADINWESMDRTLQTKAIKYLLGLYGNIDPDFVKKCLHLKDEISILNIQEKNKSETLESLQQEIQVEEGQFLDEMKNLQNRHQDFSQRYQEKIQNTEKELNEVQAKRNKLDKEMKNIEKKIEEYNKYLSGDFQRLQQKADFQTNGCQIM